MTLAEEQRERALKVYRGYLIDLACALQGTRGYTAQRLRAERELVLHMIQLLKSVNAVQERAEAPIWKHAEGAVPTLSGEIVLPEKVSHETQMREVPAHVVMVAGTPREQQRQQLSQALGKLVIWPEMKPGCHSRDIQRIVPLIYGAEYLMLSRWMKHEATDVLKPLARELDVPIVWLEGVTNTARIAATVKDQLEQYRLTGAGIR